MLGTTWQRRARFPQCQPDARYATATRAAQIAAKIWYATYDASKYPEPAADAPASVRQAFLTAKYVEKKCVCCTGCPKRPGCAVAMRNHMWDCCGG